MKENWFNLIDRISSNVVDSKKDLSQKEHVFWFAKFLEFSLHEISLNIVSFPLYFLKSHKIDPSLFNKKGFSYQLYKKRRATSITLASLTIFSYIAFSFFISYGIFSNPSLALATDNSWTQTDWSGGVGTNTSNQYQSIDSVYTTTTGQFEASTSSVAWYNNSWLYRKKITIDSSQVSSTESNFPILITGTNLDSSFFSDIRSDGMDIVFTSSDGTTLLDREIVAVSTTDQTMQAWVRIPTLSSSSDTNIYMYYGNSGTSIANNNTTWSNSYQGVWHMESTASFPDSTGNGNVGTITGSTVSSTSKIGSGLTFNGTNEFITISDTTDTLDMSSSFSITFWFSRTSATPGNMRLMNKAGDSGFWKSNYNLQLLNSGDGNAEAAIATAGSDLYFTLTGVYPGTTWYKATLNYDGSTASVYKNGVFVSSTPFSGTPLVSDQPLYLATGDPSNEYFAGTMDEARVASASRSAGWIATEYNNQNSPSTFYSVSTKETIVTSTAVLTSAIFDTTNAQSWGNLTYTATGNSASTTVKVRTDSSSDMSGATAFGSCTTITSGTDISGNGCVTDGDRYVQYEVTLTTDSITTSSPVFQDISIAYTVPSVSDTGGSVAGGAGAGSIIRKRVSENTGEVLEDVNITLLENEKENKVLLNFGLQDVESVMISEDITFADAKFIPFKEKMEWTLSEGYGEKKLYFRFKLYVGYYYEVEKSINLENGEINTISDNLVYTELEKDKSQNNIGDTPIYDYEKKIYICPVTTGQVHRSYRDATLFYITEECTKRPFIDKYSFDSYNLSLGSVQFVTQAEIDQIDLDIAGPMTLSPEIKLEEGDLVMIPSKWIVHILKDNEWKSFNSQFTLRQFGHSYNSVFLIDQDMFNRYPVGEEGYTEADIGPYLKDLKFQDYDQDIVDLKAILHKQGYFRQYETTPFFSTNLEDALKKFQIKHKLPETGNLDKETRAVINKNILSN